jgi:flavin reductase (DIM6/NTAB) family NADH-FMN oxidoreductase RutF
MSRPSLRLPSRLRSGSGQLWADRLPIQNRWSDIRGGGRAFFDFQAVKHMDRYELLLGTVLPRPITIVTTLSVDGALNAAPYSLFNVVSHDPPVVMIAVLPHSGRRLKDTAANIFATREFVVNLVPRSMSGR